MEYFSFDALWLIFNRFFLFRDYSRNFLWETVRNKSNLSFFHIFENKNLDVGISATTLTLKGHIFPFSFTYFIFNLNLIHSVFYKYSWKHDLFTFKLFSLDYTVTMFFLLLPCDLFKSNSNAQYEFFSFIWLFLLFKNRILVEAEVFV